MRKEVHRLCVENLRDSRWNVDSAGELRQVIRLDLGGLVAARTLRPFEKPAPTIAGAGVPG
jgi:hypothetical protein